MNYPNFQSLSSIFSETCDFLNKSVLCLPMSVEYELKYITYAFQTLKTGKRGMWETSPLILGSNPTVSGSKSSYTVVGRSDLAG